MIKSFYVTSSDGRDGHCFSFHAYFDIYWGDGQFQLNVADLSNHNISKTSGSTIYYDRTGRDIREGDLLKIFHFKEYRRRRRIYMYKLVCSVNDELKVDNKGEFLYAISVVDIAKQHSLDIAHKCALSVIDECEIIDAIDCFWERPVNQRALRSK